MFYTFGCMNALIDGNVLKFDSDAEAVEFASNYEARCYRIEKYGDRMIRVQIYDPMGGDKND